MIKNLTDLSVQKLKYNGKQKTCWDSNLRGFGVRVGKRTKTYVVMVGKHRKQISLGRYPTDSLKDERNKAKHILLQHAGRTSLTVDDAKEEFLDSCKKRLKIGTVQQYKSYLDYIELPLQDLHKPDIMRQLRMWDDKTTAQNHAYSTIRAYLNWCLTSYPVLPAGLSIQMRESRVVRVSKPLFHGRVPAALALMRR